MKFRIGNNRKNRLVGFEGLIPDVIGELGVNDSFVIEKIKSFWPDIVGEIIASHSIPDRIYKKTLFVAVDHSVYSNELLMMKDIILKRMSEEISVDIIKNLRAEIKRLNWKKTD